MTRTTHLGEIHDDAVYTHHRLAAILGRSVRWVLEEMIRPESGDGIRCRQIGVNYLITGESVRLWIEAGAACQGPAE